MIILGSQSNFKKSGAISFSSNGDLYVAGNNERTGNSRSFRVIEKIALGLCIEKASGVPNAAPNPTPNPTTDGFDDSSHESSENVVIYQPLSGAADKCIEDKFLQLFAAMTMAKMKMMKMKQYKNKKPYSLMNVVDIMKQRQLSRSNYHYGGRSEYDHYSGRDVSMNFHTKSLKYNITKNLETIDKKV